MIRSTVLVFTILLIGSYSCASQQPPQQPQPTQVLTPPTAVPAEALETVFEDANLQFTPPAGWKIVPSSGEYFDLGVMELFTITDQATGSQFFTIATVPLSAANLQTAFSSAYLKGPAIEEVEFKTADRGALTGIELLYQRPWGEPRWRFHDLWVVIGDQVYVFSFRTYTTNYEPTINTFDDLLVRVVITSGGAADALPETAEPPQVDAFPTPPPSARIAFSAVGWTVPRSREEIFVMNVDGSGVTSLSNSEGDDRDPAWSPDGTRIAFTSERDGNTEIYVMNSDGSAQTRLTTSPENEHFPAWSPDGTSILFSRTLANKTSDLFMVDIASRHITQLTDTPEINEQYPNWSPNGKKIVYSAFGGNSAGIYILRVEGGDPALLLAGPLHYPRWSPDGKFIAYDGEPAGCKFEIYIAWSDGSQSRQVTQHPGGCGEYNKAPSWSADGTRLVYYSSNRGELPGADIFIINIDGTGETQLTFGKNDLHNGGMYPSWSPMP